MTQCLLFDCDGTLVDSEKLCNIGIVIKFREFGIELDVDELIRTFRGWKLDRTLGSLAEKYELKLPDDFVPSYRAIVMELFDNELKPIEDIKYALKHLGQAKAVVSSGPTHKIEQALRICDLTEYFGSNIYSSYEVKIWKPDPGIYQFAAKSMGFHSEQCVVVDDSTVGVEAGYKAGMKTLFYNRFDEHCEFPNVVSFNSMKELPKLINI